MKIFIGLLFSAICFYFGVCLFQGHLYIPEWSVLKIVLRVTAGAILMVIATFGLLYTLEH